jgi:hypothetical protein
LPGTAYCSTRGKTASVGSIRITAPSSPPASELLINLKCILQFGIGFVGPAEGAQGARSLEGCTRFLRNVRVGAAGAGVGFEGVVEESAKGRCSLADVRVYG